MYMRPVSYTHLDVYKRQEEERIAQNEDIYTEAGVNNFYQDAINIAFEMGLRSGLHLSKQSDFSEEG